MKKYYCPYCGEKTLSLICKTLIGPRQTFNDFKCTSCKKKIAIKTNKLFIILYSIWAITVAILLFSNISIIISLIIAISLFFIYQVSSLLLNKFVKYDDDAKDDKYYKCSVELTEHVKHPKLYFYGTSVVLLLFEKKAVPVPVRIEPLEMNDKICKCKIAFVLEKPTEEFVGNAFTLIDNDKIVGKGRFE